MSPEKWEEHGRLSSGAGSSVTLPHLLETAWGHGAAGSSGRLWDGPAELVSRSPSPQMRPPPRPARHPPVWRAAWSWAGPCLWVSHPQASCPGPRAAATHLCLLGWGVALHKHPQWAPGRLHWRLQGL